MDIMFKKTTLWLFLIIIGFFGFESSPLGAYYFNVDEEHVHNINGEEWFNLDINIEEDTPCLIPYEDSHLLRRVSYWDKVDVICESILEIDFISFIFPLNTTRSGFEHTTKPKYFDLQDWLYLKYLF